MKKRHRKAAPRSHPRSRTRNTTTPRWMLVGAFAAGAAMAQTGFAEPGEVDRLRALPPGLSFAVDRYRGIADLDAVLRDAGDLEAAGGGSAATPATGRPFDIPPGRLGDALAAFALQTGLKIELDPPDLAELASPGVSGFHRPLEALELLLVGSGAELASRRGSVLRIGPAGLAESIDVTAARRLSSPKQSAALVDTPQSVTVVDAELLADQGAVTLRDALRNVTGISIQAGEGGGGLPGDNLAIRGFAARNDLFVDGVRDFGAYSRDPYNVEQVEVSKGPASVFSGRGSTGGAINLATKSPTLEPAAVASFTVGTDHFARATVDFNRPLDDDRGSSLRVNAMYTTGDAPGRDAVENERQGLALSFASGLGGGTRLWLNGSLQREDNLPDYGIPWVPASNVPLADYADQPAPVDFDNFYGLVDRDFEKTETGLATAIVEHDLGGTATLRSLVRAGRSARDSVITAPRFASPDSTDLNRQLQARDLVDRIVDGQTDLDLRLTTGAVEHTVVAGVELAREQSTNRPRTAPAAPLADLYDPDPTTPWAGELRYTGARTDNRTDTASAYLFDTVRWSERFEALAGVRYDHLAVDFDDRAAGGESERYERRDDLLSWRTGVVYKPRPEGSVYAAFGTSFNPSAEGNTGLSLDESTVLLDPERSRSFELGAKWELADRRLLATAALFQTEKTNARTPGIDPGDPPTVLEGRQRVRGFEIGLTGRITERWLAFASYTRLESEVLESNNPDELGNELANAPRNSFSCWTSYRFASRFELGGGVQFVDDRWNNPRNTRRAPSYWLAEASVAYDVNERLTLRLNADNLANERYIDRVGGGHFIPGAGRSVALTTQLTF